MTRAALLLVAVACGSAFGTSVAAAPATRGCGPATPLRGRHWPHVGRLVFGFYTQGENTSGRANSTFSPGDPTKAVLFIDGHHPLPAPLVLRGSRCATGARLRFWYEARPDPVGHPATRDQLARTGNVAQRLPADRRVQFRGYMHFTDPGRWRITVWQRGQLLGAVVVAVVTWRT